jgi:hypothetical protein
MRITKLNIPQAEAERFHNIDRKSTFPIRLYRESGNPGIVSSPRWMPKFTDQLQNFWYKVLRWYEQLSLKQCCTIAGIAKPGK